MNKHTIIEQIISDYYNKASNFSQSIYLKNKNKFLKRIENHRKKKIFSINMLKYVAILTIVTGVVSLFSERHLQKKWPSIQIKRNL